MNIIKQIILEKLLNEELLLKSLKRESSFSEHICAYMMSLAYLNRVDSNIKKKMVLWKKFISSKNKMKYYDRLLKYKQEEEEIIVLALNEIEKKGEGSEVEFGNLYKPFTIGILSYEGIQNQ